MTLLFVVDDGKTTAIIVEDRADELGPRRAGTRPLRRRLCPGRPPRLWRVLSCCESASQLDPDLIYNYHAAERIRRLHHLISMHRRSVTATVNRSPLGLGFSVGLRVLDRVDDVLHNYENCFFAQRSFAHSAPRIWNSLSDDITGDLNVTARTIKRKLKTFFFSNCYSQTFA